MRKKFQNLQAEFVLSETIKKLERFKEAKTIKGTLGYHCFKTIPDNHSEVIVIRFGLSEMEKTVSVVKGPARRGGRGRGMGAGGKGPF